ncbi:hypothetical protein BV20DRAFT_1078744 [Pilatotrama ljubarskyi]|nr:hypothetical protein BV20DRAFT_1078744 [Pilatotrama ljubarskyi]
MFVSSLLALALAAIPSVLSQTVDVTELVGTWSSGSKAVVTGQFANPANLTFNYPKTTGVSYAFSADGYYEVARYRFNGNDLGNYPRLRPCTDAPARTGSLPQCITGVLNWHHGKFQALDNGSLVLTPFGDGYQQIQDPCAAETNFIENYNETELYNSWQLFHDVNDGPKLHIFNFDGSPVAPLFQVYSTPNMLPTEPLRNVTPSIDAVNLLATNGAAARSWTPAGVVSVVSGVFALGLSSLVL